MKTNLKFWRRLTQISIALAFILIPYCNHLGWNTLRGNFLSFNAAGLPLADPLAAAQVGLKNGSLPAGLLIGAGIALVLALTLGTVFCSWVCPFGLLSEWLHYVSRKVWRRVPVKLKHHNRSFYIRLLFFGLGLIILWRFTQDPWLNQLSLPGWYSRFFQVYFNQNQISWAAALLLGVLLAEFAAQNRLWCRYLCPQSVLPTLARFMNPWHLKIASARGKCNCRKGKAPCRLSCHLGLNPKSLPHPYDLECTNCGDCVVICRKYGAALKFTFSKKKMPLFDTDKIPSLPVAENSVLPPSFSPQAEKLRVEMINDSFLGTDENTETSMTTVTAAVMFKDGKLLIAKRGAEDRLANKWEFPGGKVESGETPEECLIREMYEEFCLRVSVYEFLGESVYPYNHGSIRLIAYRTAYESGTLSLQAHADFAWVTVAQLDDYDFAPADLPFVFMLKKVNLSEI
jgi:ferredoxin-type protein NapH